MLKESQSKSATRQKHPQLLTARKEVIEAVAKVGEKAVEAKRRGVPLHKLIPVR
jgi:hypothetical protein